MNENLNLCEILKHCPAGTKFWSSVWGDVFLVRVEERMEGRAFLPDSWDGPHEYKASALLSYCVKHKEFMSLRQSDRYADGLTGGNCLIAKYADDGCSDFTKEGKVPCAYELGFSMPELIKALCDNKNVNDVICDILKQAHAIWNKDTQHFIEQLRNE